MVCGSWKDLSRKDIKCSLILVKCVGVELRDLQRRFALFTRLSDHFVLSTIYHLLPHMPHIGNIFDMQYLNATILKSTAYPVSQRERAQIADVNIAVDGGTARVHFDFA